MSTNPYSPPNETNPRGSQRSCLGVSLALFGAGFAGLFLSNLAFGIGLEIPDNLPFVGNLDEVLASAILFSCLSYLGINVVPSQWSHRFGAERPRRLEGRSETVIDSQ